MFIGTKYEFYERLYILRKIALYMRKHITCYQAVMYESNEVIEAETFIEYMKTFSNKEYIGIICATQFDTDDISLFKECLNSGGMYTVKPLEERLKLILSENEFERYLELKEKYTEF